MRESLTVEQALARLAQVVVTKDELRAVPRSHLNDVLLQCLSDEEAALRRLVDEVRRSTL